MYVSGYNTFSDLLSYLNHTRKICEKYVIGLHINYRCNIMFCHCLRYFWCLKNISPTFLKVFHNFRSTKDSFSRDIFLYTTDDMMSCTKSYIFNKIAGKLGFCHQPMRYPNPKHMFFYLVNGWPIRIAFISTNETAKPFTDNQSETTISWRHIRAVGGEFVVLYIVQFSQYLIKFTYL